MDAQGLQARQAVLSGYRGRWRAALLALSITALAQGVAWAGERASTAKPGLPAIKVHAPTPCLACIDWAEHLRAQGFTVTIHEYPEAALSAVKRRLKVPKDAESRHTSEVAGYFLEGHVPAEDVLELLKDKPKARGLAVPGLPRGAPGLELSNPTCETACTMLDNDTGTREVRREMFDTLLIAPDGKTKVWARH